MNLNILAYCIYIPVTFFIIVVLGQVFYRNGRVYILGILDGDVDITDRINHLLLVGYYLFNLGYVLLRIQGWQKVSTLQGLIESLADAVGLIVLMLAVLHYINVFSLYAYSHYKKHIHHLPSKN